MMQLRNLDHGFDDKIGEVSVTVRLGEKWCLARDAVFELVEQHSDDRPDKVVGEGKVIGFWFGEFCDLPENLISIEHNIMARDKETLYEMMEHGYGEQFDETSEVCALIYERIA